jgi:protein-disulfide isomerase
VSKKAWIIFAAACVAVLAGLVYVSNSSKINVDSVNTGAILGTSEASGNIGDHVYGNVNSKVVFIEYGDYQCPGCEAAYQPVKEMVEKYKDKVAFVFRNFPLTSIHPNAKAAAAASEAAGLQNKYWEMHDYLYENQSAWKNLDTNERTTYFVDGAKQLGLNGDTFKNDLSAENVMKKINFDLAIGKKSNVTATPSFYIGDKKLDDIYTNNSLDINKLEDTLKQKIDETK